MMGGAGRSTIWPQMVADACGLPIDVLDQVDAAPLGAAYLAGRAIGCWPKDRLPRYPQGRTVMPDPEARTRCEQKFRRYLHAVESERRRRQATAWD
jgi:sugar (pentulose or hexulose) kinase